MQNVETGWLIERDSPPRYLIASNGLWGWDVDVNKALRLSRREDADRLAEIIGDDAERIVEHMWG